jgi:hypothetical protein
MGHANTRQVPVKDQGAVPILAWFYHSQTLRNTTWKNSTSLDYNLASKAALNEAARICPIELTSIRNAPLETSLSL